MDSLNSYKIWFGVDSKRIRFVVIFIIIVSLLSVAHTHSSRSESVILSFGMNAAEMCCHALISIFNVLFLSLIP